MFFLKVTIVVLFILAVIVSWVAVDKCLSGDYEAPPCVIVALVLIGMWAGAVQLKENISHKQVSSQQISVETSQETLKEAPAPTEKPMGIQAQYRIWFAEHIGEELVTARWEFQKFHKGSWVTIEASVSKDDVVDYSQSYLVNVQANGEQFTIEKEMQPVVSEVKSTTVSAVEAL